jgi:hypothetical protein
MTTSPTIAERLQTFADARFRFLAEPHTYHLGERQLTPWSSWIKDYKEPFIEADIAPGVARKRGLSVEQVLAEWEHNRWVGTETHKYIEAMYRAFMHPQPYPEQPTNPEVWDRCLKFKAIARTRLVDLSPVALELPIFSEQLGLCGTVDFLGQHDKTGKLYIVDWKCTKKISTDQDKVWRNMLGAFSDLADHEHNVYSLQISFYRLLLEQAGIETAGGAIVHLPPGTAPGKVYQAKDYRARLRTMLFN